MFSIFQICSRDANGVYSPIWTLDFQPSGASLQLNWSPNNMAPSAGPHVGESGKRFYLNSVPVPIGQWVFFEVMITPAADFSGEVKVSMNGTVLFDQTKVKTRFPDGGVGGFMYVQHTAYGSNLNPTPYSHYIDDVTVSGARILSNTIYNNVTAGINYEGNSSNGTIANNICVDNGIGSPRTHRNIRIEHDSTTGTTVDYNQVYLSRPDELLVWNSVNYNTLAAFQAATGQMLNGIIDRELIPTPDGEDRGWLHGIGMPGGLGVRRTRLERGCLEGRSRVALAEFQRVRRRIGAFARIGLLGRGVLRHDEGRMFIGHLDGGGGSLCGLQGLGEHHCHRLTLMHDLIGLHRNMPIFV
jgi:hypothetical protein